MGEIVRSPTGLGLTPQLALLCRLRLVERRPVNLEISARILPVSVDRYR
jgi:hypothetical protein